MPMDQDDARLAADDLLRKLIEHQPGLFELRGAHGNGGHNMGEAIAALRLRLIEMYKTQP